MDKDKRDNIIGIKFVILLFTIGPLFAVHTDLFSKKIFILIAIASMVMSSFILVMFFADLITAFMDYLMIVVSSDNYVVKGPECLTDQNDEKI